MDVLYKCKCTKQDLTVHVPDRITGTDLMHWMNIVQACVGYDHQSRSPLCNSFKMDYIKIPFDGADGTELGVPPVKQ